MSHATIQIAFFTGRSIASCWSLSPVQAQFLSRFTKNGRRLINLNFPYEPCSRHWSAPHLLIASLSNIRDYTISRLSHFQQRYAPSVCRLINEADHTVFLAGSCGLELLNNLKLPAETCSRFSVFAYGPVARSLPATRHLTVQGQQDRISRIWFDRVDVRVNAGHMDYLCCPEVHDRCEAFISEMEHQMMSNYASS